MISNIGTEDIKAINFVGVGIQVATYQDLIDRVDTWRMDKDGRSHQVSCINAYCLAGSIEDGALRRIYNSADIAGPDGMPFVYWMRWVESVKCDRFYAPDVLECLLEEAQTKNYSFYFYGAESNVLETMIERLKARYPFLNIVGYYSPPFRELTSLEDQKICDEINEKKPDILCVGLGTPKQDYWINSHIYKIRGTVMISCGATFDFWGGRIRIAPKWIQQSGFEWLYRLVSPDFKRLWRRYTIMHSKFLYNFAMQKMGIRWQEFERHPRINTTDESA